MGMAHSIENVEKHRVGFLPRNWPHLLANGFRQGLSFNQLHDHGQIVAVLNQVIHLDYAGVVEFQANGCLTIESVAKPLVVGQMGVNQFNGDITALLFRLH